MSMADQLFDVGDLLPPAELALPGGGTVRLADWIGQPCVLFFYPKDDTPGCTGEARDFSELLPRFEAAGVRVLGISKDPPERHRKFIAKHGLSVSLASDRAVDGLADALGLWGEKSMYGRIFHGMTRTTLLLDRGGRIVRVWRRAKVAGHAAEVLEAAERL